MKLSGGKDILVGAHADLYGVLTFQGAAGVRRPGAPSSGASLWGLSWNLSGLFGRKEPSPKDAIRVADILDMWRSLEASFDHLGAADKDRVRTANHGQDPRFGGFGANRDRSYEILEHMIDGMGWWQEFFQPYDISQSSRLEVHLAMYRVYEPMRPELEERDPSHLTTDELIRIVRSGYGATKV